MVYFIYLSWKNNVLILFKWIWIEGYFSFIGPKTNFTRSLFSFCEVLIVSRTSENIEVSPAKSFTLHFRLSDKSLIYIKRKTIDQELKPEEHQLWLSAFQIFVHSEQLFVVFRIKKIQSKLEDHPIHPYILSYI